MVIDVGRRVGLKISPPVAARIAEAADNDQAIVGQELQKLALYIDASPHAPKELTDNAIDDVGAFTAEGDFQRLADLALAGEIAELTEELVRLPAGGNEGIPVVRSLQRRILMLAPARARVERGERVDAVMASLGRALFWKDKSAVQKMLGKWSADDLAVVSDRAARLERALMFTAAPEREVLGEELLAIARTARSR
jgi:DNA polymerase-3 subunit delta